MLSISAQDIRARLTYPELVAALESTYAEPSMAAHRHLHYLPELGGEDGICMATMPAWGKGHDIGTKIFTYFPENNQRNTPTVQAVVLIFDGKNGKPKAIVDGTELTLWRTASMSALASKLLSRTDASRLLLCGSGALAPHAALAHASIRPIQDIMVWARRRSAAEATAESLRHARPDIHVSVATDLSQAVPQADIVSCQTSAKEPFLRGEWIRPGSHVDLAGSHSPKARECDDETIRMSKVYMDVMQNAETESGDVIIPIQNGVVDRKHILGDLSDLCSKRVDGRTHPDDVTTYKSSGSALADLAAAELIVKMLTP
ncbi:MAG: ornithine cyclodeaminase family protein [Pseudomonadota bacterium]